MARSGAAQFAVHERRIDDIPITLAALDHFDIQIDRRVLGRLRESAQLGSEMAGLDHGPVGQRVAHRDDRSQLADIARPGVMAEQLQRRIGKMPAVSILGGQLVQVEIHK